MKVGNGLAIYCDNGFIETFTRAHLEHLKPEYELSGSPWPNRLNGAPLMKNTMMHAIRRRFFGLRDLDIVAFKSFLQQRRPQLVLAEYGVSGAAIVDACASCEVPLACNFYGYDAFNVDVLAKHKAEYQRLFEYAAFIGVQSNSIRVKLIELGCPVTKIVVNPVAPNDAFYERTAAPHTKTLISVGRFVNKKAPFAVLMAFRKVLDVVPDARLIMVGDGPLFFACKQLALMLGVSHSIEFTGRLQPDAQRECMARAAIFVQHSVVGPDGDSEGLPVAIMEASAMEMPIVSTWHSGIPEAVEHGITGLLSKEMDAEEMANNIIHLLQNSDEAMEMGKMGRAKMKSSFQLNAHIEKLIQQILGARKGN